MIIGVPREIKTREYRIGINPAGVQLLRARGHEVLVERNAGVGSGIGDDALASAGATIVDEPKDVWTRADMIMKVKEPLPSEFAYFRKGLVIYTYLHLAAELELTRELMRTGVQSVAYETITGEDGTLPLLRPMSEVAGRMAVQVGAAQLEKERGGKGILLGGVPGTRRGRVVILGGGIVGTHAARIAVGLGAHVTVLDVSADRMTYLEDVFMGAIETLYSNPRNIEETVSAADLVIGAVLIPGGVAPKLVDEALLQKMEKGSVVVDVAVDQGGCITTCRPTTHDHPTYEVHGVVHYCVPNMPGAVPQTSTFALTNVTIRYALEIADRGLVGAVRSSRHLAEGVNTYEGACTCEPVARAHGLEHRALSTLLAV